ncbi:MAG: cardiolipin synthase ClsB [Burkholderiaceae bacterium]
MHKVNFTSHNKIALLECGAVFFPALIAAIDAACTAVHLETYIFSLDDVGNAVRDALARAAARGVQVQVIADWLGSGRGVSRQLARDFAAAGVEFRSFNPWFQRGVARTHRKLCVVDRRVAFIGGININDDLYSDDYARTRLPAPRWDFAIQVEGPMVDLMQREVELQWTRVGNLALRARWRRFKSARTHLQAHSESPVVAGLVVRDNLRNRRTIQRAYLLALAGAKRSAVLANPYFAPGRKLRDALARAARRGVDVTLLIGVGQFRIQDAVAQSFYPKLLKSGVKVIEYRRTQLHAKVAVVDDVWATVGSSNCDGLSLFVNQEANAVIRDVSFSRELRQAIERGVADGAPVDPAAFNHLKWYHRYWFGAAYFLYQGVLRIITLGKYAE